MSSRALLFGAFTVLLLLFMRGPVKAVINLSLDLDNKHASQIVMIPFISAALIYLSWKNIFSDVKYALRPGLAVLIAGVAVLLAGKTLGGNLAADDRLSVMISALVVLWLGGFLFFFGDTAFKKALFPLLFLFFCVPVPSPLLNGAIDFLQRGSAEMTYVLLKISRTPVYREGFFFSFSNLVVEVAPQCSGIRSGISLVITCLLAGHVLLRSYWRRGALLVLAIPVLIFKNALRIATLSLLAVHVDPRVLTSQLHKEGGIPFFALALVLMYPVLLLLVRSEKHALKTADATVAIQSLPMQPTEAGD